MWEFDVATALHDEMKGGGRYREMWSRVNVSAVDFPRNEDAAQVAACMAIAVHGGMATQVLTRI